MKFNYEAYERLFPRKAAEEIKTQISKGQEPGNVLEEAEAKQEPVKVEKDPEPAGDEGGVIDEVK